MLALAAVFGGVGSCIAADRYRFERACVQTQAQVLAHETVRKQDKYKRWVDYSVDVYGFTTETGDAAQYKFVRYAGGHEPIGTPAVICYPHGEPESARLTGESLVLSTVMLGIGAIAALTAWLSAKQTMQPAAPAASTLRNRAKRGRKRRRG